MKPVKPKSPPIQTSERLARALEALDNPRLAEIIQRARAGYYDDFKSTLDDPQIALVRDLRSIGLHAFAQRVINGEFDATMEEGQAWFEAEGRRLFPEFSDLFSRKD